MGDVSPLDLIPGGSLTAIAAAVVAALLGAWRIYAAGQKAGEDKQKAKEADARGKNLNRIRDAADAKPALSMHDDPNNRDVF